MSITVSVIAQTFGTLYLAALVLVTQRLSLICDIHTRQTLTALHDKLSAWLGLGSSILTLVDQVKCYVYRAVPWRSGSAAHSHTSLCLRATLAMSYGISSGYTVNFLRLACRDVIVNATRFTADCGLVPDTIQLDFGRDGGTTNQWVFNVNTNVSLQIDVQVLASRAPSQLSTKGTWYPLGDMNLNVIGITSTIPVVDATGANATSVPINPELLYRMAPNSGPNQNDAGLQYQQWEYHNCGVRYQRGPTIRPATVQNDVVWKKWTVPQVPTDPLLINVRQISVVIPQSPDAAQDVGANGMYEDLSTKQTSSDPSEWNAIQVTDLQLTLGKAIAAMVWYHRNGNHSNVFSYNAAWMLNEDRVGLADVEVAVLRLRLSFNVIPLAVGLGISCGLFLITFLLSRRPLRSGGSSKLRVIGILQLTWLLGNESHLVDVRKPDHQKLRKAGLFYVQMSARAQQKMSQVEEEYEASELTVLDESHDSDSDAPCGYNR
ncbi:hypothetical protein BC629DRAFT_1440116 [Irpex lacteus]|nr:hypothetical protein BC629DRAFT_1440116 [Irpex lacteus]